MIPSLLILALGADASGPWSVCLENAKDTVSMRQCADAEFQRQDARLNVVYKKVVATQDATGLALLKKAELAWIALRDASCAWQADENRGGTLAPLVEIDCRATTTRARADELESWLAQREAR